VKALARALANGFGGPMHAALGLTSPVLLALLCAAAEHGQPFASLFVGASCAWSFLAGCVAYEDWR
jgi:hypothetical protein